MIGKLNHVAIVVPDLEVAAKSYSTVLGADVSDPVDLPTHGVTTVFVTLPNSKIELLYPLDLNSPVKSFLDRNPNGGIHHICFEVEDIYLEIKRLENEGFSFIEPKIRDGADNKRIAFLHPKEANGILIELSQKK